MLRLCASIFLVLSVAVPRDDHRGRIDEGYSEDP